MKRRPYFLAAAAAAFTVGLVGASHAGWYYNASAGSTCKAIRGLPQLGYYGELWTNPTGPVGDTFYGGISCFYDEPVSSPYTGQLLPKIDRVTVSVYDGDSRTDSYHSYDFRASMCVQDFSGSYYGCSPNKYPVAWGYPDPLITGTGQITFVSQSYARADGTWGPDMVIPYAYNGKSWADPWGGASKIMYVSMPANSRFYGWQMANPSWMPTP